MHPSSSAFSTAPGQYPPQATAALRHTAGDAVANEEEQASAVPGSPPRMLERRENAEFIEAGEMEVDVPDDSFPRGQKRKRELSTDGHERHSPPKFRCVDRDDGQAPSPSCNVTIPEETAGSQPVFDADGLVTNVTINWATPVEAATASSGTPTGLAIAIDALARDGIRLDQGDSGADALLRLAARHGKTAIVSLLLALGGQVDEADHDGNTALYLAAFNGHAEAVKFLLEAGAQVDRPDGDGDTPLHLAACAGATEAVKVLLAGGAPIDQLNGEGSTPLHLAVFNGHVGAADLLIEAGAKVHRPDGDGDMPLYLATLKGHAKAVALLLKAGAQVDQPDQNGDMPVHRASYKGYVDVLDLLLRAGAQVDLPNGEGNPPLHLATFKGHMEAVALLLKAGAQANQPGGKGNMPLHRAARHGNAEAVRLLLASGAHAAPVNDEGNTPLHLAAIFKHAKAVDVLLQAGVPIHQPDGAGDTALHVAASQEAIEAMEILLAAGARIEMVNHAGDTPLHLAAGNGHAVAVHLLLRAGAGVQLRWPNGEGNTALSLAFSEGHVDVVRLLLPARTGVRYRNLAAGPLGPYRNVISGASLVDDDLLFALQIAIGSEDVPMVELALAYGVLSLPDKPFSLVSPTAFPFALPTPVPCPIHDLLLCGPATAPANLDVTPEMIDTLVSIFEACSTARMTPKEIDDGLREVGLLSPVTDELAGQFHWAPQLKQAMAGNAPLTRAQIRQVIGGMLGELEQCMLNRQQPYGAPDRTTALAEEESDTDTPVPWLSEESQAYLTRSLGKQVQALAEMGRQGESDTLGEGVSDLLALCLAHMPAETADNAAALRHVLTAKLGMYGSLADRTVQAWQSTLATSAEGKTADASMLGTFAQRLQAQLRGAAIYSQVRSSSAIDDAAAQLMTQLMLRQWTMLEQYWKGAAAGAAQ